MLNKLFSIKNEYKTNADNIYLSKHKVITILGVKIKIKHPLKLAKIFIHNEILFNSKRIYNLGNNKNIILNITGKGNIIKLNKILGAGKLIIELIDIDNSKLEIGQNNNINRTLTLVGHNTPSKRAKGSIYIGHNNIFNGHCTVALPASGDKYTKIGNYNLFAADINIIGVSDHLVFDINTKEKFNLEENIEIGDKIWIGNGVRVLNKAKIPNNSVVAMNSIVTKKFDKTNILLAGNPASIKKENIFWNINNDDSYLHTDNPLEQK